mgnify:FL=1
MTKCNKSYSEEHSFEPKGKGLICVLCGKHSDYMIGGLK